VESSEIAVHADEVHVPERLIVAPTGGVFRSLPPEVVTAEGEIVEAGQSIGVVEQPVAEVAVVSPHSGFLMGLLVLPGERVRESQPVAWLRSFDQDTPQPLGEATVG
jgi:biotin carboxyl carrier protein